MLAHFFLCRKDPNLTLYLFIIYPFGKGLLRPVFVVVNYLANETVVRTATKINTTANTKNSKSIFVSSADRCYLRKLRCYRFLEVETKEKFRFIRNLRKNTVTDVPPYFKKFNNEINFVLAGIGIDIN